MDSEFLNVVIRVPQLFMLDYILLTNFGHINNSYYSTIEKPFLEFISMSNKTLETHEVDFKFDCTLFSYFCQFIGALALFFMTTKILKEFYFWFYSLYLIIASLTLTDQFIYFLSIIETENIILDIRYLSYQIIYCCLFMFFFQVLLAELFIYRFRINFRSFYNKNILRFSFLITPIVGIMFQCSPVFLNKMMIFFTSITFFYLMLDFIFCYIKFFKILVKDFSCYQNLKTFNRNVNIFEFHWSTIDISKTFKVFWLMKILFKLLLVIYFLYNNRLNNEVNILPNKKEMAFFIVKLLASGGCETLICVLGMSAILGSISNKMGEYLNNFLNVEDNDDRNIGTITTILFSILALQTGLTEIPVEQRFSRLYRNLCLLLAANLHIYHNTVNSLLISLSASKNNSFNRHLRPLIVCVFLTIFPIWFLNFLWQHNSLNTWLLAVTAFCIEIIIKVFLTILIYSIFMIDSYYYSIYDKIDDYVFYINSFENLVEFFFAVFIFFNGVWILMFESGGAIRLFMIGIHAYFNIFIQAKRGYMVIIKRLKATSKLNLLKNATEQQLINLNDVCSICYQEFNSAKVTECNHFFHAICLRKWLNFQDICPLCHKVMYKKAKVD